MYSNITTTMHWVAILRGAISESGGVFRSQRYLCGVAKVSPDGLPTTVKGGAAFEGDLKSVSGLGVGDGINTHTGKWMQVKTGVSVDFKGCLKWKII